VANKKVEEFRKYPKGDLAQQNDGKLEMTIASSHFQSTDKIRSILRESSLDRFGIRSYLF